MKFLIPILLVFLPVLSMAQQRDSLVVTDSSGQRLVDTTGKVIITEPVKPAGKIKVDTAARRKFSPRQAAIRSAIFPGLGQIYNKKYWKVPIVYAAVGIPVYFFFDNKTWYNRTRYALAVVANNSQGNADSLNRVHKDLLPLVLDGQQQSLIRYRNEFRKNMDYSILFTLLFWGLNIVDATVDAHLKGFTVSDDLSLQIKPTVMPGGAGLSLVFSFNEKSRHGFKF